MQNKTEGPQFQEVLVQDSEESCNSWSCPTARDVDFSRPGCHLSSRLSDLEPEISFLLPKLSLP